MRNFKLLILAAIFLAPNVRAEFPNLNSSEMVILFSTIFPLAVTSAASDYTSGPMPPEAVDAYARHIVEIEGPSHLVQLESDAKTMPTPILIEALKYLRRSYRADTSDREIIYDVLSESP